jgi:hypothetical protein
MFKTSQRRKGAKVMWPKMLPAALLALVLGFFLGCVPGLNQYLHWNLWYVIPISGLLFGCAVGGIQFGYCFKVGQRISGPIIIYLAVAAMLGYIGIDYGIYKSTTITMEGHEEIPDGNYKLSELLPFWQYMKINLGGSTVRTRFGTTIERGFLATTISYFADLFGAAIGAVCVLLVCRDKYPFCIRCERYKQREQKYEAKLMFDEQQIQEIFGQVGKLTAEGVYENLVAYCQQLSQDFNDAKGDSKLSHFLCY